MLIYHRVVRTAQLNEEWEPAFGTYGWLWITLAGIAVFTGYKFVRRRIDQAESERRHEKIWGRRQGETEEHWSVRVQRQKDEELKLEHQWDARAREQANRRPRRSTYNSRGDFDPPGGWGAMGPDNG